MTPCKVLTPHVKELGKKLGINNEDYLRALYTRWCKDNPEKPSNAITEVELKELLNSDSKEKTSSLDNHFNELGVLPEYKKDNKKDPKHLTTIANNEITLYKNAIRSIEDFLRYFKGDDETTLGKQRKEVFKLLADSGKDLQFFERILPTITDAYAFALFIGKAIMKNSKDYDKTNLLGEKQIKAEISFIEEAINELEAWQNKKIEKQKKESSESQTATPILSDNIIKAINTNTWSEDTVEEFNKLIEQVKNEEVNFERTVGEEQSFTSEISEVHAGASIILGGTYGTEEDKRRNPQEKYEHDSKVGKEQEAKLEAWAKANDLWLNDYTDEDGNRASTLEELLNSQWEYYHGGTEADVYRYDDTTVLKSINLSHSNDNVSKLLDRIALFNELFPETALSIVGFGRDSLGHFRVIVTQNAIVGRELTNEELQKFIAENELTEKDGWYVSKDGRARITDLSTTNVMIDTEGNYFVIDADVVYNTPEYGGNVTFSNRLFDSKNAKETTVETPVETKENSLEEKAVVESSPVNTDIISVDINTPRAKLNQVMSPITQIKRAKLIADTFYNICDAAIEKRKVKLLEEGDYNTLLEWEGSVYGRAKAIKTIPVKELLDELQKYFRNAASTNAEYAKIWDNFLPLLEDACVRIQRDSAIRLTIKATITSDGTNQTRELGGTIEETREEEDPNMQDNTEGEATDNNDLCTHKARHTDPHATVSLTTKHVLRRLPLLDSTYQPLYDDLGNMEYVDEEYAHAVLVQELSKMLDSDEFALIEKDENGEITNVTLPILDKLATKIPWAAGLRDLLEEEPDKIAAFYHDFRNTFVAYYIYTADGVLKPMNQSNAIGSTMAQIKRDYEAGRPLSVNTIYDTLSNIIDENVETVKDNKARVLDLLDELDEENEDEVNEIVELATDVFKSVGIDTDTNVVKALLFDSVNHNAFKDALGSVGYILNNVNELEEGEHLVTQFNTQYKTLSEKIGKVSELENMASFRQGKKTYYSFSAPNMADTLIGNFKSEKAVEYIEKEFGYDDFFFKNGEFRNKWLAWLSTDASVRDNLASFDLKNILGKDYNEWTPADIDKAFLTAYFTPGYKSSSQQQYAYYNFPIFSDSPVAKFIKMPRFTENYEDSLLPLLRDVVLQEVDRMKKVEDRDKAGAQKITNYDGKRGREFCFFPDLNGINPETGNHYIDDIIEYNKRGDVGGRNDYIEKALYSIMNVNFIKFQLTTNPLTEEELKNLGHSHLNPTEALREYYWNSVYAQTQIIQITTGDLAFYKNAVDFQKRYKQVYAAGKRLFTNSPFGRKYENVIYLKDSISSYNRLDALRTVLDKAVSEGRISKMDADNIMYKFKDVNATDAQGFRTLSSYKSVLDMMGQWTPTMESAVKAITEGNWDISHFNIIWQTVKPFMYGATIKPDGLGGKMRVMHQNKDSEFLLLATLDIINADAYSPKMVALNAFMEANNIDLALYESGCKTGNQGIIDLNYSEERINELAELKEVTFKSGKVFKFNGWNDKDSNFKNIKNILDNALENKEITSTEYDEIFEDYLPLDDEEITTVLSNSILTDVEQDSDFNRSERPNASQYFNPEVVHTFSYADYMVAQPTPEHLMDTETIFGSQFRNLIISDLPDYKDFKVTVNGVEYTRQEIIDLYNGLIIDNLLDSFDKLKHEFSSIEAVQKKLKDMVEGNPKFDKDILQALELVEIEHPITHNKIKTFNIPLDNPSTTEKLQELILSAFKNGVTKQKIKGGNAILVSSVGYTDELHRVVDDNGTLVGYECMLPATSKQWFEPLLTEMPDGKGGTYQMLDITKLDDGLKEMLGFRI